jgi:RNA polymerase sigma-70 factor (ECF subfamily)
MNGNVQDYSILINRHKDLAFTIAYRLLNSREDAEEVVQDAFVKAYRNLKGFRKDSRFSTWLFRIVYNTAISCRRSRKRGFQRIDQLPDVRENQEVTDEEWNMNSERGLMLDKAMKQLPEEDRALITLFYLDESSVEEIHEITGLSRSNIKVKLFRARKKLQEFIAILAEKSYF